MLFGNVQSYLPMIRYIVSLQVQNGIRNVRLSYQGTKNVAIYAFSSGKFLYVRKYACVKDLTNIMSADIRFPKIIGFLQF